MISVIIPVYNEKNRISSSLTAIANFFKKNETEHEIIVVDDGSTDGTYNILNRLNAEVETMRIIHYSRNKGKGYAVKKGVLSSSGDLILITDADLSTPIEQFPHLAVHVLNGNADIAIGSRALPSSIIIKRQPWWREKMGKTFNRIVKMMIIEDFHDTQCGFKIFKGDVARRLFSLSSINGFAFDVEILAFAKKIGYRIKEIPVLWVNSSESKVRPFLDSIVMFKDLFRIMLSVRRIR